MWGKIIGDVGTTQGARLGAVYTRDGAVIKLGEVNDICFTEPLFCISGFTVSLWLKHRTIYTDNLTVRQVFVAIGDYGNGDYSFSVYQKSHRTEEHLAVRVSASSKRCVYIFPVPRSVWSLFAFVWNTTDLNIYRNGLMVKEFMLDSCTDESQRAFQHPAVILKGDAMFDDLQIWNRALTPNEIGEMFTCIRGNSNLDVGFACVYLSIVWTFIDF